MNKKLLFVASKHTFGCVIQFQGKIRQQLKTLLPIVSIEAMFWMISQLGGVLDVLAVVAVFSLI